MSMMSVCKDHEATFYSMCDACMTLNLTCVLRLRRPFSSFGGVCVLMLFLILFYKRNAKIQIFISFPPYSMPTSFIHLSSSVDLERLQRHSPPSFLTAYSARSHIYVPNVMFIMIHVKPIRIPLNPVCFCTASVLFNSSREHLGSPALIMYLFHLVFCGRLSVP